MILRRCSFSVISSVALGVVLIINFWWKENHSTFFFRLLLLVLLDNIVLLCRDLIQIFGANSNSVIVLISFLCKTRRRTMMQSWNIIRLPGYCLFFVFAELPDFGKRWASYILLHNSFIFFWLLQRIWCAFILEYLAIFIPYFLIILVVRNF